MDLQNITEIRLGNVNIEEIRLGSTKIWPLNSDYWVLVPTVTYYNTSYQQFILANGTNGNSYAKITATLQCYKNGARYPDGDVSGITPSVAFSDGSSSGATGAVWSISSNTIKVTSRGKNEDIANTNKQFTVSYIYNNKVLTSSVIVYQQQNVKIEQEIIYSTKNVSISTNRYTSSNPCPASGSGTGYATISVKGTKVATTPFIWTSGATDSNVVETTNYAFEHDTEFQCYEYSGRGNIDANTYTFPSMGTTVFENGATAVITVYIFGTYIGDITLYQEPNIIESYSHVYSVSISANKYTTASNPCPASGGTCTISFSGTDTYTPLYTSGRTGSGQAVAITPHIDIESGDISLNDTNTVATWASRGTTVGSLRSSVIVASYGNVTKSVTIYQQANAVVSTQDSYSLPTFTKTASGTPTRAGGGSASTNYWSISYSQVRKTTVSTYTSGSQGTSNSNVGNPTISVSGTGLNLSSNKAYWDSMGTTIYNNGRSGNINASYGGGVIETLEVTQEANVVVGNEYSVSLEIDGKTSNFSIDTLARYLPYICQGGIKPTYTSGSAGEWSYINIIPTSNVASFTIESARNQILVDANLTATQIVATISASFNGKTKSIQITQAAQAKQLEFASSSISAGATSTSTKIEVIANVPWKITIPNISFITSVSPSSGTGITVVQINFLANMGSQRSSTLTLSGTGIGEGLSDTLTVTQATGNSGEWIGVIGHQSEIVNFSNVASENQIIDLLFKVNSNISVNITGNSGNWFSAEVDSYQSGTHTLTITCLKDNLYEVRTGTVTIKSSTATLTVTIHQNDK